MPHFLFTVLVFALCSSLSAQPAKKKANKSNTDDMWVTSPVPALPTGVTHHTFRSDSMKREIGYCIYLPPGYERDTELRYPVIYHLHGAGGNETRRVYSAGVIDEGIMAGKLAANHFRL